MRVVGGCRTVVTRELSGPRTVRSAASLHSRYSVGEVVPATIEAVTGFRQRAGPQLMLCLEEDDNLEIVRLT